MKGVFSYLADAVSTAASNIRASKVRSLLTVIIVTLGITCLVGAQTAIDSLSTLLENAFGTNAGRISITPAKASRRSSAQERSSTISYIEAMQFAAGFDAGTSAIYTCLSPLTALRHEGRRLSPQTTVLAFEGDYFSCNAIEIGQGRGFSRSAGEGARECVVGKRVASQLGGKPSEVIGSQICIGSQTFRVAGVIKDQSSLLGVITDNTIYIPLRSAFGPLAAERGSFSIDISIPADVNPSAAVSRAEGLMRSIRHLGAEAASDFEIIEGSAAVREIERLGGSLKYIALIIGLMTLCGAAVALANIMLICVAERTREVGIRRAVGATRGDIRAGFICEALLICEAGCIAGTLLGILCGNILSAVTHTPFTVPWKWILIAQAISMATGIAACTLPARRASAINVVEALRCE